MPTDRPVFRPSNGSIENRRSPGDRVMDSTERRRRLAIDYPDPPKGTSSSPRIGNAPSPRSDRGRRGSRSHGHLGHHHRHHYGCGHYGFGYGGFGYGSYRFGYHSPSFGSYSPYYGIIPYSYYPPYYPPYYRGHRYYGDFGDRYETDVHISTEDDSGARSGGALGALDLDIEPQQAEIFVDGYLVGDADQFDGYPNYLWLEEGVHELAFYREGYETIFRQYTIYPGVIIDVDDKMRPGNAIRPNPPAIDDSLPDPDQGPLGPATDPSIGPATDPSIGRIAISGSPRDAAIYLDGHFVGTAAEISELAAGLIVEPGEHVVELVRPGYDTERVPISVPAGEQVDLNLSLKER